MLLWLMVCGVVSTVGCIDTGSPPADTGSPEWSQANGTFEPPCPGGFTATGDPLTCVACPAGSFEVGGVCSACPAGSVTAEAGQTACTVCPAGTQSSADRTTCVACSGGKISAAAGQSCTLCPAGTGANDSATVCDPCPPGRIGVAGRCKVCGSGKTPNFPRSACRLCAANEIGVNGICLPCPDGKHPNSNAGLCVNCPPPTVGTGGTCEVTCTGSQVPNEARTACVPGGAGACQSNTAVDYTTTHSGGATWYQMGSGNLGHCGFPGYDSNTDLFAALNSGDYGTAEYCGAFARVTNKANGNQVVVQIIDSCPLDSNPICTAGHLDLSHAAFALLDDPVVGVLSIEWTLIEAPNPGPLSVQVKDGSNPFWAALQVRDHRHPIATLGARPVGSSDAFTPLERQPYNYFVAANGLGDQAEVRVTDIFGHEITLTVTITPESLTSSGDQLPTCAQ